MSYRLIDSNAIAIKYPEVNEMPCVFADLPNGMNGQFIDAQPEPSQVARDIATIIENEKDMRVIASAQPERKTGKWLPDNNNYYEERFICSVCGRSYKVDTCMGKPMWDFCPCGADMRGAES